MTRTIKDRIILAVGVDTYMRPRELQVPADADEHSIVHALYTMEKQGLVAFKKRNNLHAPGINVTKIHLTKKGQAKYRDLRRG